MFHHPLGIWGTPWTTVTTAQATDVPGTDEGALHLLWADQPDYYNTTLLPRYWDAEHADAQVNSTSGYLGLSALTGASIDAYVLKYLYGQSDFEYFGMGHRMKIEAIPSAEKVILAAVDGAGAIQCCVTLRTDLKLQLYRGNISASLATSATALSTAKEYRIGFKGRISPVEGFVEVYIDNDVFVRISGVNTAATSPAVWRGIQIGLFPSYYVSHMYAGQGTGALLHDFLGVVKRPAAIRTNEWATIGAGSLDDALDETTANDDTDYAQTNAVGNRFATEFEDITSTTQYVYGTRNVMVVRNLAAGPSTTIKPVVINPDGDRHYAEFRSCSDSEWRAIDRFDRVNPFTGERWQVSEVNGNYGWGGESAA